MGQYMAVTGALIGYSIDPPNGALTQVSRPITIERSLAVEKPSLQIDPSGMFVYVPGTDDIYAATIDATTGALTQVPGSPFSTAIPG